MNFNALIQVLDGLFASLNNVDIDLDFEGTPTQSVPPGVRVTLLVGMEREERLYLRARLALAGITTVDEAESAEQASRCLAQRHYDVVMVSLELRDADPWAFVQTLPGMLMPPRSVIVVTQHPTWAATERAEQLGCMGLLEMPFAPSQVLALLQKL
jgi:DNA-binding NtrC family response regulator